MRHRRVFVASTSARAALSLVLVLACAETRSDSGIPFRIRSAELDEQLRIDGSTEVLIRILPHYLSVRDDGVIVVAQYADRALRFFARDGRPLATVGRRGRGPGEFYGLLPMGWRADTLWVYDDDQRRITFINPDMTIGRIITDVPETAQRLSALSELLLDHVYFEALGASGDVYVTLDRESIDPDSTPLLARVEAGGSAVRILAVLPRHDKNFVRSAEGRTASVPSSLRNHRWQAFSRRGDRLAVAKAIVNGPEAGMFALAALSSSGDTVFSQRFPFEAEPITPEAGDSILRLWIKRLLEPPRPSPDLAKAAREQVPVPDVYPPITNLMVGRDGTIWVEQRAGASGRRAYYVITAEGEPWGTLELPIHSRVAEAELDRIWVVEEDSMGVPSILRYETKWFEVEPGRSGRMPERTQD